jgi:hypothetical protein
VKTRATRIAGEAAAILAGAFAGAMLFFLPLLQESREGRESWLEAIYQTFFVDSQKELLLGKGVDLFGSFWMVQQVQGFLLQGKSTVLESVYYPFGFDLGINTGFAWVDAALGVPLAMWLGMPGFYNLHVLVVLGMSIASCALLFRVVGLPLMVALPMAWLSFIFPFSIDELNLGRPTQVSIWPMALLLCIFVYQQSGRWKPGLGGLAGLCMALACLTYWFTAVGLGLGLVGLYLHRIAVRDGRLRGLGFGLAGIVTSLGVILPITWRMSGPLLQGRAKQNYAQLLTPPEHVYQSTGLGLDTVLPLASWDNAVYIIKCSCQHIPIFFLVLLCCLLPHGRKRKMPWVWLWVFTLGLSVSSGISLFGLHLPTGLAISEWIFPPMLRCQFEGRNVMTPHIVGYVVLAMTLKDLLDRHSARRWLAPLAAVLFIGGAIAERPTKNSLKSTQFVKELDTAAVLRKSQGALLSFPVFKDNYSYIQQIYHRRPIFGGPGMDTVRPIQHARYGQNIPLIRQLDQLVTTGEGEKRLPKKDFEYLYEDGFRWIMVHAASSKLPIRRLERLIGSDAIVIESDGNWLFPLEP